MKILPIAILTCLVFPALLTAQSACTYDTCAIRIEGTRLVAGQSGNAIATLGPFKTPGLDALLATSDSATAHYADFRRNYVPGNLWTMLGGAGLGLALAASNEGGSTEVVVGSTVVGVVASIIGSYKVRKAQASLARSIWWYNRDLQR